MIKEASYFSLGQDCLKTETQDMVTLLSLGFRWLQTVKEISSLETLCLSPVDQSLEGQEIRGERGFCLSNVKYDWGGGGAVRAVSVRCEICHKKL